MNEFTRFVYKLETMRRHKLFTDIMDKGKRLNYNETNE